MFPCFLQLKFERQARLERQRTVDVRAEAAKLADRCAAAEAALEVSAVLALPAERIYFGSLTCLWTLC